MSKKYGLILPGRSSQVSKVVSRPSIFDDDDDDDASFKPLKKATQKKKDSNTVLKRQAQLEIEKALGEDPTAFDYDAVYDSMQADKAEKVSKLSKKGDSRPKYIQGLLKAAEKRKLENERRTERTVHKERLAEKDEYADKESFVTESYKKKMEQLKADEEEEKKRDALEAILDVTKQNDLSGFYRNLYKQTTGDVPVKKEDASKKIKDEKAANEKDSSQCDSDDQRSRSVSQGERDYHQRRESSSEEDKTQDRERRKSRERKRSRSRERKRTRSNERKRTRSNERIRDRRSRSRERRRERSRSSERKEKRRGSKERSREKVEEKPTSKAEPQSKEGDKKEEVQRDRTVADPTKLVKRTTGQGLSDARARFLARKKTKQPVAIARDDD